MSTTMVFWKKDKLCQPAVWSVHIYSMCVQFCVCKLHCHTVLMKLNMAVRLPWNLYQEKNSSLWDLLNCWDKLISSQFVAMFIFLLILLILWSTFSHHLFSFVAPWKEFLLAMFGANLYKNSPQKALFHKPAMCVIALNMSSGKCKNKPKQNHWVTIQWTGSTNCTSTIRWGELVVCVWRRLISPGRSSMFKHLGNTFAQAPGGRIIKS